MSAPEGMVESPFRLAMRTEGKWIVCYFAERGTMKGSRELGRVRNSAMRGTESAAWAAWLRAMEAVMADLCEDTLGYRPETFKHEPAPEHERSGHS